MVIFFNTPIYREKNPKLKMKMYCVIYRETFQFGQASYDLYWTFEQLLDEPSAWFGFIVLSAVALMPDMALMTISRYFYRTKTQLAQVSNLFQ